MNPLVKHSKSNHSLLWNDPVNRFFRNNFMDYWNAGLTDTIPSINILEEKDKYKVELAVPGLKKEDMNIHIDGNLITISSETSENKDSKDTTKEGENYSRREYNYSSFSRSFTLPENADTDAAKAKYADGVLLLNIPKKKEAIAKGPKKVSIE